MSIRTFNEIQFSYISKEQFFLLLFTNSFAVPCYILTINLKAPYCVNQSANFCLPLFLSISMLRFDIGMKFVISFVFLDFVLFVKREHSFSP